MAERHQERGWGRRAAIAIAFVVLAALPAALVRAGRIEAPVELETFLFGLSVVAAAFAMSWAAEAAERDVPRALALIVVALIAVLPEYAVDIVFAWKAARDPTFAPYAAANMTGSNRLLLGLGWSTVALLAWLSRGERRIRLDRGSAVAVVFLAVATLYSFALAFRSAISLADAALLGLIFALYTWWAARSGTEEPELVGPAAAIGALPTVARRVVIFALFGFAGTAIALAAEPFADGLVRTGAKLGIDEFLLVQWLAPLASEAPEFIVAALIALRGKATVALALLLSAKVNQWTLLIGSLAVSYSLGGAAPSALPLDERQKAEVLLTAAQSLFGVAVLASLTFSLREAGLLAALFVAQLVVGGVLRGALHNPTAATWELTAFTVLYVLLAGWCLAAARGVIVRGLSRIWLPRASVIPSQEPRE